LNFKVGGKGILNSLQIKDKTGNIDQQNLPDPVFIITVSKAGI
jgi:hypothetical protein